MREKRNFAERTRFLKTDEAKKKYFLVYEGECSEDCYFKAVESLRKEILLMFVKCFFRKIEALEN